MTNKNAKLYLFLQPVEVDGKLDWAVRPGGKTFIEQDSLIYEIDICQNKRNQIRIDLFDKQGTESHLLVKEIRVNDQVINQWEICTRYVDRKTGKVEQTYGYLGKPGTLFINLHQNPLVHNYVSYFLSRCRTDTTT